MVVEKSQTTFKHISVTFNYYDIALEAEHWQPQSQYIRIYA